MTKRQYWEELDEQDAGTNAVNLEIYGPTPVAKLMKKDASKAKRAGGSKRGGKLGQRLHDAWTTASIADHLP